MLAQPPASNALRRSRRFLVVVTSARAAAGHLLPCQSLSNAFDGTLRSPCIPIRCNLRNLQLAALVSTDPATIVSAGADVRSRRCLGEKPTADHAKAFQLSLQVEHKREQAIGHCALNEAQPTRSHLTRKLITTLDDIVPAFKISFERPTINTFSLPAPHSIMPG